MHYFYLMPNTSQLEDDRKITQLENHEMFIEKEFTAAIEAQKSKMRCLNSKCIRID